MRRAFPAAGRKRRFCLLLVALLCCCALACGPAEDPVRDVSFRDTTPAASAHDWAILAARIQEHGSGATLRGRLQYRGAWVTSSCQIYVNFLDAEGTVLCAGLTELSFDKPIAYGEETGYQVPIVNFFNFDSIVAVEIEFG